MAATRDFEFCTVCKRHYQDGIRHKYFPNHLNSLSSFLSKFQSRLSDVHFFLKNPTVLLPQHASRNRLWFVFCDRDVHEIGSSFACSNAIRHLASASHLKSLNSFFWKNGASMDQVDSFVIHEPDLAKWKSKCNSLQKRSLNAGDASKGSAAIYGPSNDIHNQIDYLPVSSIDNYTVMAHDESNTSSGVVMPLHRYTNENYQVWTSQMDQTVRFDSLSCQNGASSAFQPVQQSSSSSYGLKHNAVISDWQRHHQIPSGESVRNVHTGAPPPWLDPVRNQDTMLQGSDTDNAKLPSQKSSKSRKLNPKRVGAAWAEKRKLELEMEKRGEMSAEKADDCWLPNFGRVWQTGSRKVSKKEFELEKQKLSKVFSQSEMPAEIRPYVSKKRRTDGGGTGNGYQLIAVLQ